MSIFEQVKHIAYLGPGGSYTEMAKDIFCKKYDLGYMSQNPMRTIKEVLDFVNENPNTLGVVPVENSVEGTVRETLDNIIKTNDKIRFLSENIIPVKHCLISRTTEIYSISGVIAHPKAISQCQAFLKAQFPYHLELIEVANTDEAAKKLQNLNLTYAAIGTEKTAQDYNLNILKDNINDDVDNKTRFALVGNIDMPKTENDFTTIAFSLHHKTGALLEVLQIFQKYSINIIAIDSRPGRIEQDDYTLFVNFKGNILDETISKLYKEIEEITPYIRLVGSFERF